MSDLDDLLTRIPVSDIAKQLGVDDATARSAVEQAVPALLTGLQQQTGEEQSAQGLAAALAQLPEEQRAVLLLVTLEEMRYADVASTLGIAVGTVMSRLSRGRERLRQILAGEAPSPHLRVVR